MEKHPYPWPKYILTVRLASGGAHFKEVGDYVVTTTCLLMSTWVGEFGRRFAGSSFVGTFSYMSVVDEFSRGFCCLFFESSFFVTIDTFK